MGDEGRARREMGGEVAGGKGKERREGRGGGKEGAAGGPGLVGSEAQRPAPPSQSESVRVSPSHAESRPSHARGASR